MSDPITKAIRLIVDFDFQSLFNKSDTPVLLRVWNFLCVLALIPWPILFFMSLFANDAPENESKGTLLFIATIAYPFLVVLLIYLSHKLSKSKPAISYIFTTIATIIILAVALLFFRF